MGWICWEKIKLSGSWASDSCHPPDFVVWSLARLPCPYDYRTQGQSQVGQGIGCTMLQ